MNTTTTETASILTVTREEARQMTKAELQDMLARNRVMEWPALHRNNEADALVYVRQNYPTKRDCIRFVDCVTRASAA